MQPEFDLTDDKVQKFLSKWFSGGKHQFGQFRYENVEETPEGLLKYIRKAYLNDEPAFHSVEPVAKIEKWFWEFDTKDEIPNVKYNSPELNFLWSQAKLLSAYIEGKGGKPLIIYSGRRGYHVWVYAPPVYKFTADYEKLAKKFYKKVIIDLLGNETNYPNLDRIPLHVNAMARIPFSFHQKTGNQVVPLTMNREPFVPDLDEYINNPLDQIYTAEMLGATSRDMDKAGYSTADIKDWKIRKCILNAFLNKHSHSANLAFVIEAIFAGKTDKEIHEIFALVENYDYDLTQYQIEYQRESIKSEGYKPIGREKLKEWGIITQEECEKCGACSKKYGTFRWSNT